MTSWDKTRGIGSDFESPDDDILVRHQVQPPWATPLAHLSYVQIGRGALRGVARLLKRKGYGTILVPSFHCHTMMDPFRDEGWSLVPIQMTKELSIDADALVATASSLSKPFVVFIAEYFGRQPTGALIEAIGTLRAAGALILDDETHRIFHPGGVLADIAVGSLRKLLPVADGAYVRAVDADLVPHPEGSNDVAIRRWAVMDERASVGLNPQVRANFAQSNQLMEGLDGLAEVSDRSLDVMMHLDYFELVNRRLRNASVLVQSLDRKFTVLNFPGGTTVPSHLVVRVKDPQVVQATMAAQRIFCPIHWPVSTVASSKSAWPVDFLSLPVDHRYGESDMERIAECLVQNAQPPGPGTIEFECADYDS